MSLRRLLPWLLVCAAGCAPGSGAGADGGEPPDAATVDDGGVEPDDPLDGGTRGAGDGGLAAMDPKCANRQGGEECWAEWLKQTGRPDFAPVAVGALGAGPWPTDALVLLGRAAGIEEPVVGVGTDTAQNVYAVSEGAFFVRRPTDAKFERVARNSGGLRDFRLASVAGGGPGVAYVGYEGVFGIDPAHESNEVRKSGDVQKVTLRAGGFDAVTWDTHNSNTPHSGKFDHSRTISNIVVPRRGPAAGEVFLGTEHGIVRYQTDALYADHRHIATVVLGSQRFGMTGGLTVTDDGTVWYGNAFVFGGLAWTPRLAEWYFDAPWLFPSHGFGSLEDHDDYEGIAVDSKGDVWAAGRGHGLAHLIIAPNRQSARLETVGVPDSNNHDLVVDADDTLWLATDSGVYRGTPDGQHWSRLAGVDVTAYDLFLDDVVAPRTLWIATRAGVFAYRGP